MQNFYAKIENDWGGELQTVHFWASNDYKRAVRKIINKDKDFFENFWGHFLIVKIRKEPSGKFKKYKVNLDYDGTIEKIIHIKE